MSDTYQRWVTAGPGAVVAKRLGLPRPPVLTRWSPGQPTVAGPVLVGGAPGGRLLGPVDKVLDAIGADVRRSATPSCAAVLFDATGVTSGDGLRAIYDFVHPVARQIAPGGRLVVLGTPPETCADPRAAAAQQALEGFVRSTGKELGRGTTSQLVYVAAGAGDALGSTLRFLLSPRSAYVSGQVVRVTPAPVTEPADWSAPLAGQVALVTGAAQGIGAAIAATLARDGAHVVALDIPAQGEALAEVAGRAGGETVQLDLTRAGVADTLAQHLLDRHGGVDVVVHNAGVTRDRTLGRMTAAEWDAVLDLNLSSQERIDDALLGRDVLRPAGRVVCVSSLSGIAGNPGQTNYAASKAGVIGRVRALAPSLGTRPATINAVAPGFIETRMTAAMPFFVREAGRRLNSLRQGGLPVDVAETVAWLTSPASAGVTGNIVRVCGQSLLGA